MMRFFTKSSAGSRHPISVLVLSLLSMAFLLQNGQPLAAQTRIDATAYKKYLADRKGMTSEGLMKEFPAGVFLGRVAKNPTAADFIDSIVQKYQLTPYEQALLSKHGFVVTERANFRNFHDGFYDAFIKDLPVYISADAVLHAYHKTYSEILKRIELLVMKQYLDSALIKAITYLRGLPPSHSPTISRAHADADILLTTALRLSTVDTSTVPAVLLLSPNNGVISELLEHIATEKPALLSVFTSVARNFDFSQVKPRGHYAGDPDLEAYFRALMWLGRTEIYITEPLGVDPPVPPSDVRRQCNMAVELGQIFDASGANPHFAQMEAILSKLIGEQDNLSTSALSKIVREMELTPDALDNPVVMKGFQDAAIEAGAGQQILSQILTSASDTSQQIAPAASFITMGQRFLLDSYILGNVVFDKVAERLMPSPLDAMFVLGNDATAQILTPEIDRYSYAANLAALRFLTSGLDTSYWETSVYTSWLGAIRGLNPPLNRSNLPQFMQTAAWWQKSINTQLASWAELRHDNLLYGKQSYTGGLGCFYPKGFVEPVPNTYRYIGKGASQLSNTLNAIEQPSDPKAWSEILRMIETLDRIQMVTDVLQSISHKELQSESLTHEEERFINNWLVRNDGVQDCVTHLTGHFHSMFFDMTSQVGQQESDFIIADVHTQPTDESGNPIGRVLHVGTGFVNTAVIIAEDPQDKCLTAYVGPVSSYYEHITEGFNRLTDAEWAEVTHSNQTKQTPYARPTWTNLYLANIQGQESGSETPTLHLSVATVDNSEIETTASPLGIAPNPTTGTVLITLTLPASPQGTVHVTVVDHNGSVITNLTSSIREAGPHIMRWDGRSDSGSMVAPGTYTVVAHTTQGSVIQRLSVVR